MKYLFPLLIALLVVAPRVAAYNAAPTVAAPASTFGFELTVPTTLTGDKGVAQEIAGLCNGLAHAIELDGRRATPRLKYCVSILDLRQGAIDALLSGSSIDAMHPAFGPAVGVVFNAKFPDGSAPLTPELRAAAVDYFKALAYVCGRVK